MFLEGGKIPPQAVELEEAVLGAAMQDKEAAMVMLGLMKPEMFYKESNQEVFKAIASLFNKSFPIDILTVTEELKNEGVLEIVGGPYEITMLISRVSAATSTEYHCRIIIQKYLARKVIAIASEAVSKAYEDTTDVFELLTNIQGEFIAINQSVSRGSISKLDDVLDERIEEMEKIRSGEIAEIGIMTYIPSLNNILNGLRPTDLIIIAARPSMGKTALALSLAKAMAKDRHVVGFFSMEMSKKRLVDRLLAVETNIPTHVLARERELTNLNMDDIATGRKAMSEYPLFIDDTPALNIIELRSKIHKMKIEFGIDIVFVDYLQLMTGTGEKRENREREIAGISSGLKQVAKDLDIPVVALSQLSRKVEDRPEKRPKLADLRESGAIEQDADIVMLLYRPGYYGKVDDSKNKLTPEELEILGELDIAKHRNGSTGNVKLEWKKNITHFVDWENPESGIEEKELDELPF